jgi:hypothetical protein
MTRNIKPIQELSFFATSSIVLEPKLNIHIRMFPIKWHINFEYNISYYFTKNQLATKIAVITQITSTKSIVPKAYRVFFILTEPK